MFKVQPMLFGILRRYDMSSMSTLKYLGRYVGYLGGRYVCCKVPV